MNAPSINPAHVVEALCTIHLPGAAPEQIHRASQYLNESEREPEFPLLLMEIYGQSDSP